MTRSYADEFSVKTEKAAAKRADGKCENIRAGARCNQPFTTKNRPQYHHIKAVWRFRAEGIKVDNTLANCACVGSACCHKELSAEDKKHCAKADAVRAKNIDNIRPQSRFARPHPKPIRPDKQTSSKGHAAHLERMRAKGKLVPTDTLRAQAREYGQD